MIALSALLLPVGDAQPAPGPLPDLISDPPRPSVFSELTGGDGSTRLVLTFDGYVHNVGEGPLEVAGNPQLPDGMQQRVRTDGGWETVGTPTVRYETDDGHNHFHLIEAIEYVLWNESQGSQTAVGSKIGFCLVDSEQMEAGVSTAAYSEELDNFCDEDDPLSTDLRMGISAGWRDIYDATTTLQWVDVSNVAPGRYWIGAITDPNDEIVESNEDNNGLIFSDRTISVPGFAPVEQPDLAVDSASFEFELKTMTHGEVTTPVYTIESAPSHGRLDVPIGVDLDSPMISYSPQPGFSGVDEVTFSVRDAASPYPLTRPLQTLTFAVDEGAGTEQVAGEAGQAPDLSTPSTFFETTVGLGSEVSVVLSPTGGGTARLFASGLPAGLTADSSSGLISGVALDEGIFDVELLAVGDGIDVMRTQSVTWIVNAAEPGGGLGQVIDRSTPRGALTRTRVGTTGLGLSFEALGLPPGLEIEETAPFVVGTPTEVGVYDVELRQIDSTNAGEVLVSTTFTWTIRATTAIDFVL